MLSPGRRLCLKIELAHDSQLLLLSNDVPTPGSDVWNMTGGHACRQRCILV